LLAETKRLRLNASKQVNSHRLTVKPYHGFLEPFYVSTSANVRANHSAARLGMNGKQHADKDIFMAGQCVVYFDGNPRSIKKCRQHRMKNRKFELFPIVFINMAD
jgi:hypothetical protein